MTSRVVKSLVLLIVLGALFAVPVAAKTWSAHGALAALATAFLVVVSAMLGPLSFAIADVVGTGFITSTVIVSRPQVVLLTVLGAILVLYWWRLALDPGRSSSLYLPVTGWAMMSAWFWISIVFAHTT